MWPHQALPGLVGPDQALLSLVIGAYRCITRRLSRQLVKSPALERARCFSLVAFRQASHFEEVQERQAAFVELTNATSHWAHRERQDGLRTPVDVLSRMRGQTVDVDVLQGEECSSDSLSTMIDSEYRRLPCGPGHIAGATLHGSCAYNVNRVLLLRSALRGLASPSSVPTPRRRPSPRARKVLWLPCSRRAARDNARRAGA